MHLLFLTDNFPPEVNAPANRTYQHVIEWVAAGHQVTVITGVPNFPKGKVFSGYKNRLYQKEKVSGITVVRVWTYIAKNEGFLKRTLDYVSFMIMSFLASFFIRNVDVVIGTSPQFFTAVSACGVATIKRKPFIFELRDLWPESIKAVGAIRNEIILKCLTKVEMLLYRRASLIVCVTTSFVEQLKRRGIASEKLVFIPNGVDLSLFRPTTSIHRSAKFKIGYLGTIGMAHNLQTIIEVALHFQNMAIDDIEFVFVGDGSAKVGLIKKVEEYDLKNVRFLDTVGRDQVPLLLNSFNISVVHLKKTDLFKTVIPSKIFESMAVGTPILHGVEGESAEIIQKSGSGVCFEPENVLDAIEKIHYLKNVADLAKYKSAGIQTAAKYCRKQLAKEMLNEIVEKSTALTYPINDHDEKPL